jgi:hypothetical protein
MYGRVRHSDKIAWYLLLGMRSRHLVESIKRLLSVASTWTMSSKKAMRLHILTSQGITVRSQMLNAEHTFIDIPISVSIRNHMAEMSGWNPLELMINEN